MEMGNQPPDSKRLPFLVVVMGPTAGGKSDLSLRLATRLDGEIISADSMQIYRGLDVGTAKPTPAQQALVPHHLIDVLDLCRAIDVHQYVELATKAVFDVASRKKLPILVGGTGMYIRSLLYGLAPLPGDAGLRHELAERYDGERGFRQLKLKMVDVDPLSAERFARNKRKMLRALEVYELTGRSIIDLRESTKQTLRCPVAAWYLKWNREELKRRIRLRTIQMFERGWIEETREAVKRGLLDAPTAWQALGYKLINDHERGALDHQKMTEKIVTATWRLAKRQITWFERQHPEAKILNMPIDDDGFEILVETITTNRQASS